MGSTEPDRSLSSGVSIPQWMKQKAGDRYDFDDTAFSPPSSDDNFFYIRYPKPVKKVKENSKYNSINEFLEAKERISKEETEQHTSACRRFMPEGGMKTGYETDHDPAVASLRRKGPPALEGGYQPELDTSCGHSVVQVAQQMTGHLAGTVVQSGIRGYLEPHPRLRERRGSKSLPASPISSPQTSPKSGRRAANQNTVIHNRYFTPTMMTSSSQEASGFSRGSILSRLLGVDGSVSRHRVHTEESEEEVNDSISSPTETKVVDLRRNKSTSALLAKGMERPLDELRGMPTSEVISESVVHKVTVIKPKPSELREMNFWSPTSM